MQYNTALTLVAPNHKMPVILSRYRPLAPGGREEQRLTAEGCLIKNGQLVVGLPRRRNSDGPCQKGSVSKSGLHVLTNDFPKSQAFRWLVQKEKKKKNLAHSTHL